MPLVCRHSPRKHPGSPAVEARSRETLSRHDLRITPGRFHALTGAYGRWSVRVSASVTLADSDQKRWALSLTQALFRNWGDQAKVPGVKRARETALRC